MVVYFVTNVDLQQPPSDGTSDSLPPNPVLVALLGSQEEINQAAKEEEREEQTYM